MPSPKKVVLAYSGGLDTSVILRWLIEQYKVDVIAYCADLGQGEELIPVRDKALRTGASAVHIVDLRAEFVRDFIFPMLRANAVYEGSYLLGTSIARPLIAKAQVEIALKEGADAVARSATASRCRSRKSGRTRWTGTCSTSRSRAACSKTRGTRRRPRCSCSRRTRRTRRTSRRTSPSTSKRATPSRSMDGRVIPSTCS